MTTSNGLQQKELVVSDRQNSINMEVTGQSWISILCFSEEVIREESRGSHFDFIVIPGQYVIKTDGEIQNLSASYIDLASVGDGQNQMTFLKLNSDAPDQHIVDGIGEVPADGTSFCNITIAKHSLNGTPLTSEEHQDELFLRTTGGLIMDATGETHIRSLHLQSGQATFRLISEANPKLVTVSVLGQNPNLPKAEIQIEFI